MIRVCVLIGEGKSDKAFFSSLLINKFSFSEYFNKNCIVFQSIKDQELFWILPVPSYGPTHQGGFPMLQDKKTYLDCKYMIINHEYVFGKNPKLYYRIITDTDGQLDNVIDDRNEKIEEAMQSADIICEDRKIFFANEELETWFLAGMDKDFPLIRKNFNINELINISDLEKIRNPKEYLYNILDSSISGGTQIIGRNFGEYINLNQATLRSKSFKKLLDSLISDDLIIIDD